jgi:hypothetical protein
MRAAVFLLLLGLVACHPMATPLVVVAGLEAASVATFHRDGFDLAYSLIHRRDCSIVHLERGETYCRPAEPEPAPQQFCTRTLGMAECFAEPATLNDHPSAWGDAPALNAAQEKDRTARWPNW